MALAAESKTLGMEIDKKNSTEVENVKYRGWRAMPFIIGNETFEKLGAIGTLANLLIYLTSVFHFDTVTAATIILVFNGTTNFGTLIGAFLSDTFFGRYKTLGFATFTSFLGLLAIQLTAAIPTLHPLACGDSTAICKAPTPGQLTFLFFAFGLLIIGASGVRPCNFAFGADQFNPKTEAGKRGIDSFFNWYFFTYTFAQMVSLTLIVYIQSDVSWSIGLAIPAILMLISCIVYFIGSKIYVKVKATGSPLTSVAQVIVTCIKKRKLKESFEKPLFNYIPPNTINSNLPYTEQFRFLDKAAILTPEDQINPDGSAGDPWTLCSMQQVEEVKLLLRVLPVMVSAIFYLIPIAQLHTYAIFQAQQTDRRLGISNFKIPAATYVVFEMLGLTIFIPIYDRIAVPLLRKITKKDGGITILQRMGTGIFLTVVSMLVSGIVEERRRTIALTEPTLGFMPRRGAISSMSSLWLVPQLAIAGVAEGFTSIGQVEFYYKQFPENMKSIAGSLFFCGLAASNYISMFLIRVVHRTTENAVDGNWLPQDLNKGRLDYYYFMIAGLGTLNFGYFLVVSKWYKYKETAKGTIQVLNGEEQI
ncbi:hypothetical protein ACFE04_017511 [Oxalis oulophora]